MEERWGRVRDKGKEQTNMMWEVKMEMRGTDGRNRWETKKGKDGADGDKVGG